MESRKIHEGCPSCSCSSATSQPASISPRIDHLILTNSRPLDQEINEIRACLDRKLARVVEIDFEIGATYQRLQRLKKERLATRKDCEEYKNILHPARRLSNELLCEIFRLCSIIDVDDDILCVPETSFVSSLDVHKSPWNLGQVCRHWRDVALSYRPLWSTICLSLDSQGGSIMRYHFLLGTYLQRSGSHPLSVWVRHVSPCEPGSTSYAHSVGLLNALLATSFRWRFAVFDFRSDFNLLAPLQGNLPALRGISLGLTRDCGFTHPPRAEFLRFTPKLTEFHCIGLADVVGRYPIQWEQLKAFTWTQTTNEDRCQHNNDPHQMSLLKRLKNIQTFRPSGMFDESFGGDEPSIFLPELQNIFINNDVELGATEQFLNSVLVPALKTLEMSTSLVPDFSSVIGMITRSQCALRDLEVTLNSPQMNLIPFLRVCPTVEKLKVYTDLDDVDVNTLLRALIHRSGVPALLPNLIDFDLSVEVEHPEAYDPVPLVAMAESRLEKKEDVNGVTVVPLKFVTIEPELALDDDPDLLMRVEHCSSKGFEFCRR